MFSVYLQLTSLQAEGRQIYVGTFQRLSMTIESPRLCNEIIPSREQTKVRLSSIEIEVIQDEVEAS